ncbi:MAG TPA: hypothetical protein DD670_08340 [Planctomycetaceae bacterium]|nr:hypothetical protein [Planctomycetaceae bacterium]
MARILYLYPSPIPPSRDKNTPMLYLSDDHFGEVLQPVWPEFEGETCIEIDRFRFWLVRLRRIPSFLKRILEAIYFIFKGVSLHRSGSCGFDLIISYGWNTTGIVGTVLKWLTGAKLIVEIPGAPGAAYLVSSPRVSWRCRVKARLTRWILQRVLDRADGIRMLYPTQLDRFPSKDYVPRSHFPDFVSISRLEPTDTDERFILLLGYPWYLKGADVLIRAFHAIKDEFPDHRLRIVGHCPDRAFFEQLRQNEERIEFQRGIPNAEAMRLMASCSVFVLASRTEGMGRVLLEAMALRKPIVASRVDGIPYYVKDGENGLLFESENVVELAFQLRRVLGDRDMARRLADNGYRVVHEKYSEKCFAEAYDHLIEAVLASTDVAVCRDGIPNPRILATPDDASNVCASDSNK